MVAFGVSAVNEVDLCVATLPKYSRSRRNNQNFSQIIFYRRMLHINKKLRIKTSINYEKTTSDKNKYLKIVIGRSLTDENTLEYFKIQESL